jgi:hypothetical protein
METRSPTGCKQEAPKRSDSLAAWGMLLPPSCLQCRRSSSLWLRLDLKPTIKRVPLRVAKRDGREIENIEIESLPAAAGGDWRGETPPESPPEGSSIPPSGVSINTTIKISTSPSPSTGSSYHPHCNILANMMYDAIYSFPMIYCVPLSLFE